MSIDRKFKIDGAVGMSLVCALGIVFIADRFQAPPASGSGGIILDSKNTPNAPLMKLAVTPPEYDDMGKLLDQLGPGYAYTKIKMEDLEDFSTIAPYEVVFLTCGGVPRRWVAEELPGNGDRPGTHHVKVNEEMMAKVKSALRTFVGKGGTLYASDWRFHQIRESFPELGWGVGPATETGSEQTLTADVVDPGLRDVLGSTLALRFDLPGWYPAQIAGDEVTTYLRGTYQTTKGGPPMTAPLLVKVPFEQGTIIFTSFHNEKVNSDVETKLLKFLVFAAVTARESAQAERTMISGGFKPQKQNLLSASPEAPSATQTYFNSKRGRLRFALSFGDQGAHLKLTVRGPDGASSEKDGTSTFSVDVPDAAPGNWTYTVTAVQTPASRIPVHTDRGK